jgi:signal peptidase II
MRKWLMLSLLVIVVDQWTKSLVLTHIPFEAQHAITSFFDIVDFHNEGAAFSFLASQGGWQRIFFSLVALIASMLLIHLLRKPGQKPLVSFALSMILGGALGNLYDRLTLGYVVDFLLFHVDGYRYYWPAFNVADSAICLGVGMLLLDHLKTKQ